MVMRDERCREFSKTSQNEEPGLLIISDLDAFLPNWRPVFSMLLIDVTDIFAIWWQFDSFQCRPCPSLFGHEFFGRCGCVPVCVYVRLSKCVMNGSSPKNALLILHLKSYTQNTHMLNVWNIYLHLPNKWPSFVGKYTSTMEHLG